MKKIIGFDIDGVLTDERHQNDNIWHHNLCQYLGRNITRAKDSYSFYEAYDIPNEVIQDFLAKRLTNIYQHVTPANGVKETLTELKQLQFEIILITARNPKFRSLTENWLNNYHIPYNLLFHEEDKAPLAKKMGIELFIEDSADNAEALNAKKIPVVLVDKYHNQHLKETEQIIRTYNWNEIRKIIFNYYQLDKTKNIS